MRDLWDHVHHEDEQYEEEEGPDSEPVPDESRRHERELRTLLDGELAFDPSEHRRRRAKRAGAGTVRADATGHVTQDESPVSRICGTGVGERHRDERESAIPGS